MVFARTATIARRLILRRYRTSFDRWSIRGASPKRAGRRRTEHIPDPEMNDGSWYQRLVAVDYARERKPSSRCDCQSGGAPPRRMERSPRSSAAAAIAMKIATALLAMACCIDVEQPCRRASHKELPGTAHHGCSVFYLLSQEGTYGRRSSVSARLVGSARARDH